MPKTIARPLAMSVLAALAACSSRAPAPSNQTTEENRAAPADALAALAPYLPAPGSHAARAMRVVVPADYERLSRRMLAAMERDPAWFETYARQHAGVRGTLPYHPHFGMTEAEYRRMVSLIGQSRLEESGRGALTVTRAPGGGLALAATGPAAPLNGIVLHPESDSVNTPLGRLGRRVPINQNDPNAPTGPWTGVQWSNEGGAAPGAPRVKLAIGRRAAGEMLIYYDVPGRDQPVLLFYER